MIQKTTEVKTTSQFLTYNLATGGTFELRTTENRDGDFIRKFFVSGMTINKAMNFIESCQRDELDVYYCGNPVEHVLTHDNGGTLRATRDADISRRFRLMLDLDVRGDDLSLSAETKDEVLDHLSELGITPEYVAHTGHGWQISLRLDADNTTNTTGVVARFLGYFADKFNDQYIAVDGTAKNLARLMRLPGTKRFKGTSGQRGSIEVFNGLSATVLKLEDLEMHQADRPKTKQTMATTTSGVAEDYYNSMGTDLGVQVTMSDKDIRGLFSDTKDHKLGFTVDCPHGRSSAGNVLVTITDGRMATTCHHDKCQSISTKDHLKALGVKLSAISTFYDDKPMTDNRFENWLSISKPQSVEQQNGERIINTRDGLKIIVPDVGNVFIEDKAGKLHTAHSYIKKKSRWLDKVEAKLRKPSHQLDTVQRLVGEVVAKCDIVNYSGVLMAYDGAKGGYTLCDGKDANSLIANELIKVTAADVAYLLDEWGCSTKELSITNPLVSSVLTVLRQSIPQKDKFDLPNCVSYSNGIWSPENNKLIDHGPEHFLPPSLPFEFSESATCPKFEKFLAETYHENEQRLLALEMLGTTHIGDVSNETCNYLHGRARSGKGVLRDVAAELAGGCASPSANDLSDKNGLFCVIGKKMICINEAGDMSRQQVAVLKAATGNDAITIHVKYGGSFDGKLSANWWILSNQLVSFPDSSGAVMSRLVPLVHKNGLEPNQIDRQLKTDLLQELPGIARLAREAYLRFQACGYTANPHADDLLTSTKCDSSPVAVFVDECCILGAGFTIRRDEMFGEYCKFSQDFGHDCVSKRTFASELKSVATIEDGPRKRIKGNRQRSWLGIKLR